MITDYGNTKYNIEDKVKINSHRIEKQRGKSDKERYWHVARFMAIGTQPGKPTTTQSVSHLS